MLAHNPISNLRLASGIANLQLLLAKGVSVAIGTDGAASNDNQNMWEALKLTAILHRAYGKRARPTPKALRAYGERWKPHRSAAAWYLWRAASEPRRKPG